MLDSLFRLMTAGMLQLSTVPVHAGRADATRPLGWSLARADAGRGAAETVSRITSRSRLTGRAAPCSRCSTGHAIERLWFNACSK